MDLSVECSVDLVLVATAAIRPYNSTEEDKEDTEEEETAGLVAAKEISANAAVFIQTRSFFF